MTDIVLPDSFLRRVAGPVPAAKVRMQTLIIDTITPVFLSTLLRYEINTDYRICYFTGQVSEESDSFCATEEYASGAAYEGREDLGNTHPGDGRRYKGRGLIELTGRDNYALFGPLIGVDLIANPERAAEPAIALEIACLYWRRKGLSALADNEDIETITHRINGGPNGLDARQAATDRAFAAFGYKVEG